MVEIEGEDADSPDVFEEPDWSTDSESQTMETDAEAELPAPEGSPASRPTGGQALGAAALLTGLAGLAQTTSGEASSASQGPTSIAAESERVCALTREATIPLLRDLEQTNQRQAAIGQALWRAGGVRTARPAGPYGLLTAGLRGFALEVKGSRAAPYEVRVWPGGGQLPGTCTCRPFSTAARSGNPRGAKVCRHIVAAWYCIVSGNFTELVAAAESLRLNSAAAAPSQDMPQAEPWEVVDVEVLDAAPPGLSPPPGLEAELPGRSAEEVSPPAPQVEEPIAAVDRRVVEAIYQSEYFQDQLREVVQLRGEVGRLRERLRAAESTPTAPSPSVTWLSAGGTLNAWCRLCREATRHIYIACFTFALPQVAFVLEGARARGVAVRLLVSGFDLDLSVNQGMLLERLKFCGCEVRAYFVRRLRAKVLMTEREIVVGSCNFTVGSQVNVERSVVLRYEQASDLADEAEWFHELYCVSCPFVIGMQGAVSRYTERPIS